MIAPDAFPAEESLTLVVSQFPSTQYPAAHSPLTHLKTPYVYGE